MKILICGLPGAGKTWLAERLIKVIDNCAWYNADVVRRSQQTIGILRWKVEYDKPIE